MRRSGAMASFAPGVLGRFCTGSNALEMGIFGKIQPDVRVAAFTDRAPDIAATSGLRRAGRRRLRKCSNYGKQQEAYRLQTFLLEFQAGLITSPPSHGFT